MTEQPSALQIAVVRQEQIRAFAVVLPDGRELSLLLAPAVAATEPTLRPGDLVAVRDDAIVGHWPRGVALRSGPGGWGVRLGDKTVVTVPADPALLGPDPLLTGDPVWVAPDGILGRAWPWYEPQPAPRELLARLEMLVGAGD